MLKSTKDLILSVFRSYKKEYPLTEHVLLNIETVERMLKIEPISEEPLIKSFAVIEYVNGKATPKKVFTNKERAYSLLSELETIRDSIKQKLDDEDMTLEYEVIPVDIDMD